eukprot:SAG11_NODE_105_length_16528_cov_4.337635_14_plen_88_part_01
MPLMHGSHQDTFGPSAGSLKNLRVHHASGLVRPDSSRESTALLYALHLVIWTFHLKVPYVDSPQLNAIRHKKFRTQKVLFRAVPSEYS